MAIVKNNNCNCDINVAPGEYAACFGSVEITDAVLQDKEVQPTTEEQVVVPDIDCTGLSSVTVAAVDASIDDNIAPENIKKGVTILGVEGAHEGGGIMPEEIPAVTIKVDDTIVATTENGNNATVEFINTEQSDVKITAANNMIMFDIKEGAITDDKIKTISATKLVIEKGDTLILDCNDEE